MTVDDISFRLALSQFATGVTVILVRDAGGALAGLTVSSFASVSLRPPLVLFCVDLRSDAHDAFAPGRGCGVSVLGEDQDDVSRRFAARGAARYEGFATQDGATGVPLVPGAVAHIECVVVDAHRAGDHTVFVAEVRALRAAPGRPLLYHRGAYRRIAGEDGER